MGDWAWSVSRASGKGVGTEAGTVEMTKSVPGEEESVVPSQASASWDRSRPTSGVQFIQAGVWVTWPVFSVS